MLEYLEEQEYEAARIEINNVLFRIKTIKKFYGILMKDKSLNRKNNKLITISVFACLYIFEEKREIIDEFSDFITLNEILKFFVNGKLYKGEKYKVNDNIFCLLNNDTIPKLVIEFKHSGKKIYLNKLNCAVLNSIFNKVISETKIVI